MRIIALAFLVSTSTVLACPDLRGTYATCRSTTGASAGSTDMVVQQVVQNRTTTYTVSATNNETGERETEVYKADGKSRSEVVTDPDSGMSMETITRISCSGNVLNINIDFRFMGEAAGYSRVKVSKRGSELIIDSRNFDGEEEVVDKEICL